jgi:quercetin dioxygenase-like cupin family protein
LYHRKCSRRIYRSRRYPCPDVDPIGERFRFLGELSQDGDGLFEQRDSFLVGRVCGSALARVAQIPKRPVAKLTPERVVRQSLDVLIKTPGVHPLDGVDQHGMEGAPPIAGGGVVTPSAAQPAPATVQQILSQPLADLPGREVRISIVERGPGTASAPHRHPGHHTFGYVVEGTYEFAIDRQAPRLLKAGDTFYEPPGAVHSTSRNPSADQRVKILVFMVADQKNPTTVPE